MILSSGTFRVIHFFNIANICKSPQLWKKSILSSRIQLVTGTVQERKQSTPHFSMTQPSPHPPHTLTHTCTKTSSALCAVFSGIS